MVAVGVSSAPVKSTPNRLAEPRARPVISAVAAVTKSASVGS